MITYKVTRTTPSGEQKVFHATTRFEVGKHVADVLCLNCGLGKPEATRYGMQAETESDVSACGYTFVIEKESRS